MDEDDEKTRETKWVEVVSLDTVYHMYADERQRMQEQRQDTKEEYVGVLWEKLEVEDDMIDIWVKFLDMTIDLSAEKKESH